MIDKDGLGNIEITCDVCGQTVFNADTEIFTDAIQDAKDEGWTIRRLSGNWHHACPDCEL